MTGQTIDFLKHCKHEFGAYVQTHKATTNTMAPCTIGAIPLRPTGNEQGGWYYLSLNTGRGINCLHATELPMPKDVVSCIHQLAHSHPKGL